MTIVSEKKPPGDGFGTSAWSRRALVARWGVKSLADRFWDKVGNRFSTGECWSWIGAKSSAGYGILSKKPGPSPLYAHRISWELNNGPIPHGACVLHRCDNPPCVNPDHLFLGSKRDNSRDMAAKGRAGARWGEQSSHHLLTDSLVREMRRLHSNGLSYAGIGAEFDLSKGTVQYAVSRGWRHIQ